MLLMAVIGGIKELIGLDDAQLMDSVQQGNPMAFRVLVERYKKGPTSRLLSLWETPMMPMICRRKPLSGFTMQGVAMTNPILFTHGFIQFSEI